MRELDLRTLNYGPSLSERPDRDAMAGVKDLRGRLIASAFRA